MFVVFGGRERSLEPLCLRPDVVPPLQRARRVVRGRGRLREVGHGRVARLAAERRLDDLVARPRLVARRLNGRVAPRRVAERRVAERRLDELVNRRRLVVRRLDDLVARRLMVIRV